MYVYMCDSADCRPVHPPPRFCPWLLHPAIPVCEGGGPRPYAMRDSRAGPSPRNYGNEEKEEEKDEEENSLSLDFE